EPQEIAGFALEGSRHAGSLRGIASDVESRCVVAVHGEGRRISELGKDHVAQIGVNFALFRIGARHLDPVTIRRRRRPSDKMIVLICGDNEQRVIFGDPVLLRAIEEFAEGLVVCGKLLDVPALAGAEGATTGDVIVVGVGDITNQSLRAPLTGVQARLNGRVRGLARAGEVRGWPMEFSTFGSYRLQERLPLWRWR
ncbi:MAG TPA: hypothetical protein VGA15_17920, partial [Bradyrhizobium sp.]